MSADVVNLRQARKAKARAEKDKASEANRRLHGMSRAERAKAEEARARLARHVEGHRRETDGEGQ